MSSEIFRDRSEGAAAKRADLLRKRRDELVTMPHAIRRVVVARSARIAGSVAAIVGGGAFVALANKPAWVAKIAEQLPGQPAVLAVTLASAWAIAVIAYLAARARAEHKFAVAMSRYVLPGEDVDHDLQRLDHEHPDDAARHMAQRLEVKSAALPILAAALLVPATAVYLFQVAHLKSTPLVVDVEEHFARHAEAFAWLAALGAVGAIATTWSALRRPVVARILPAVVVTAAYAPYAAFTQPGWVAWTALAIGVVGLPLTLAARRLRLERVKLDAEDPTAGTETITLAGIVRGVTDTVAAARRVLVHRRLQVACGVLCAVAGMFAFGYHKKHKKAAPELATVPVINYEQPTKDVKTGYHVEQMADGRLRIDVVLTDTLEIPSLAELEAVPAGWRANVTIEQVDGGTLKASPFPDDPTSNAKLLATNLPVSFYTDACDGKSPALGLHIEALERVGEVQQATLYVTPTLSLGHCQLETP